MIVDTESGAPPGSVLRDTAFATTYAKPPGRIVPVVPRTALLQADDESETDSETVKDVGVGIVHTVYSCGDGTTPVMRIGAVEDDAVYVINELAPSVAPTTNVVLEAAFRSGVTTIEPNAAPVHVHTLRHVVPGALGVTETENVVVVSTHAYKMDAPSAASVVIVPQFEMTLKLRAVPTNTTKGVPVTMPWASVVITFDAIDVTARGAAPAPST